MGIIAVFKCVYIHFPFCEVICHYCDFYTARAKEARHQDFFQALHRETQASLPQLAHKLDAIYLGGGTPGLSPPDLLFNFLHLFRSHITEETEISLEVNPANVTAENVKKWKDAGVNRISMGIQSLEDNILKKLGRTHSGDDARRALEICLKEISNVSGDLIYSVPEQKLEAPSLNALEMAKIGVSHFSAYHLSIPQSHFLFNKLPTDQFAWDQIKCVLERLASLGFSHYEVSNFSKSGFESKNNSNYWRGGAYLALGPSAHGFDGKNKRWKNIANWETYVLRALAGESVIEEEEFLSQEQRKIEVIFTALRTSKGLDLAKIRNDYGVDLLRSHALLLDQWEKEGLARVTNGHLILTFEGRMLGDEIAQKLI